MSLITLETPDELRRASREQRRSGRRIALVPTMGALHPGHLSLVQAARQRADWIVLSLFVNPAQFGPNEDLDAYPHDLEGDRRVAEKAGVDVLYHPAVETMYPPGDATLVQVSRLTEGQCCPWRPGHIEGVSTVVTKLLAACEADVAVFGRKDYQQWRVIQRMTRDLALGTEIVGAPIVREADGLALSSRNRYLSPAERTAALALPRALEAGEGAVRAGETDATAVIRRMREVVDAQPGVTAEYLEIVDARELQALSILQGEILLAGALCVGPARLIDNREMKIP